MKTLWIFSLVYLTQSFQIEKLSVVEKKDIRQLFEELFDVSFQTGLKIKSFGEAPKHMIDIYQSFVSSNKSSGEIVRNIYPVKGLYMMFFFLMLNFYGFYEESLGIFLGNAYDLSFIKMIVKKYFRAR